jgi:hypothetical protein
MNVSNLFTLAYWNHLARAHLPELIMILAAAIVVLLDRPIRRSVHRIARPHGALLRFLIFLMVCSFGYAAITLGCAALLKIVLTINRGALMAPIALGILIAIGIIAERQREL